MPKHYSPEFRRKVLDLVKADRPTDRPTVTSLERESKSGDGRR
jgi:hypothetical protein